MSQSQVGAFADGSDVDPTAGSDLSDSCEVAIQAAAEVLSDRCAGSLNPGEISRAVEDVAASGAQTFYFESYFEMDTRAVEDTTEQINTIAAEAEAAGRNLERSFADADRIEVQAASGATRGTDFPTAGAGLDMRAAPSNRVHVFWRVPLDELTLTQIGRMKSVLNNRFTDNDAIPARYKGTQMIDEDVLSAVFPEILGESRDSGRVL